MFDKEVLKKIKDIIAPVITGDGLEFINIEFKAECGRRVLRIFIDKENGVDVEDCATISRKVSSLLDSCDLIPGNYYLEVSSPGLDRPLFGEADFIKFDGRLVKIKISHAINKQKNFSGYLRGCRDNKIVLEEKHSGRIFEINLDDISRARLEPEFD